VGDPSIEKGLAERAFEPRVYRMKGHGSNWVRYNFLMGGYRTRALLRDVGASRIISTQGNRGDEHDLHTDGVI
jgi:hypothetical protein